MPSVALVVVTHNSAAWIPALARTWHATAQSACEAEVPVVIADAGSQDESAALAEKAFPGSQVLRLSNRGFGASANAGVSRVAADWIILCNADLTFPPEFLGQVLAALRTAPAGAGCIAPQLLNSDGTPQPSVGRFPTLGGIIGDQFRPRMQRKYISPPPDAGRVDWATGACLLFRRDAFQAVGGFDEKYFLYVEEVDLQRRLYRAGYEVYLIPWIAVMHHQPNAARAPRPEVKRYAARGMLRYFAKFGGGLAGYRLLALLGGRLSAGEAMAAHRSILERNTGP